MPELPDVELYVTALRERIVGETLVGVRLRSPFLLRTVEPPLAAAAGRTVASVERLGKRIVFGTSGELFVIVHLMIAGRLAWEKAGARIPGKVGLAAFDFPSGTLVLREAGTRKRASLHLAAGRDALRAFDRGGLEVLECSLDDYAAVLTRENHTLKRALTDPRLFSGIGNAYSDEILHRAGMSPMRLTSRLAPPEIERLWGATRTTLHEWSERLHRERAGSWPKKVTAFRDGMAVHGRYRQPCPTCGHAVQRIVYAENECNYCAHCQNEGRLLADRALSRLLKQDWPRTLEELEEVLPPRAGGSR